MDIAGLSIATPAKAMPLRHPATREPLFTDKLPVEIMVLCPDHPDYRAYLRKKRDKMASASVREVLNAEQMEAELNDNRAALVQGVNNLVLDGKPFVYSKEAFRALLADERFPWVGRQIEDFASDYANFIKG